MKHVHGRAFIDGAVREDVLISIDDGLITEVAQTATVPDSAERVDGTIVPGFVDVHVHGGDGADFMDAHDDHADYILAFHARHGTTALAATTLSASRSDLHAAVDSIVRTAQSAPHGAEIVAIHLEGPFISPERAGAQSRSAIRAADIHELASLLAMTSDLRWMMTVAPEASGVEALIEQFRDRVLFSIGHTSGGYAATVAALGWGARHFTHLYNAMTPLHHRDPGAVGAALSSVDATAELIADGIHVHPAALRIAAQALPGRIALVTDAMRACGLPEGKYQLYDLDVVVADGAARLADGTLAGSVLTMDRAVKNMVELAGLPIETVIPFATSVPARIAGVADRKGRIDVGCDADLVVLDERLSVTKVWVRGRELNR